jgi:hypothetical protein
MPANNPRLGAGDVSITLDGEEKVLRPTLRAAQSISRQSGGIAAAIEAIGKVDFDALVSVIALGLGIQDHRETKDLAERVWRTGMTELSGPAIRYLAILANGGRPNEGSTEGGESTGNP